MLHIPLLRKGIPYKSLAVTSAPHYQTREPFVEIGQANAGLLRRDLLDQDTPKAALDAFSTADLLAISKRAAEHFLNGELPVGDGTQKPDDYVRQVSATTGLPHVMVRKNMRKIHGVLAEMRSVLNGLTRNVDFEV